MMMVIFSSHLDEDNICMSLWMDPLMWAHQISMTSSLKLQSQNHKQLRDKLRQENRGIVIGENYSLSHLWNKSQGTNMHPFVCYWRENVRMFNNLISESLNHNTTAVHLFQRHVIGMMTLLLNERRLNKTPMEGVLLLRWPCDAAKPSTASRWKTVVLTQSGTSLQLFLANDHMMWYDLTIKHLPTRDCWRCPFEDETHSLYLFTYTQRWN